MSANWICHPEDSRETRLVPVFRRKFEVRGGLKTALLSLTAHGIYEAELNSLPVTLDKFTPGLTSYYHRIQVQKYDVTALLHEGENVWQTTVGDGWWRWSNNFGPRLALWGKLKLAYEDGTAETVGTDGDFEVGTGPVIKSDLQMGEVYDARREPGNWLSAAIEISHTDTALIPTGRGAGAVYRDAVSGQCREFGH